MEFEPAGRSGCQFCAQPARKPSGFLRATLDSCMIDAHAEAALYPLSGSRKSMQRREVIKLFAGKPRAVPLPPPGKCLLFSARFIVTFPQRPALKTLNPHQDATVITIADLIIPADGHGRAQRRSGSMSSST